MDFTGRTLAAKYKITAQIGQGGMGAVWSATHQRTGRKVAIKTLDEKFLSNTSLVQRFGREARAASAIQHPGIVEVLDLDQTDEGIPFIVMEFLEGETLARRIEKRGRLGQEEMLAIAAQLLQALDAAHVHGVVHRDLKPDNIMLVPSARSSEQVKILDFGISQKSDEIRAQLTIEGSVLGTPHYMSPEQAMGEPDVDGRADIYGAAMCLYEAIVGDVPFDAPNYNRLLRVILNEEPVPPRERGAQVDPAVESVIMLALQKDRARRPQSAGSMWEMLQAATHEHTAPFDRERLDSFSSLPAAGSDRTVPSSPAFQYRSPEPAPVAVGGSADDLIIDFGPAKPAPPSAPGQGLDLPSARPSRPMPSVAPAAVAPAPAAPLGSVRPVAPSSSAGDERLDDFGFEAHDAGSLELDESALAASKSIRPRSQSARSLPVASDPVLAAAPGRGSGAFRATGAPPAQRSSPSGTTPVPATTTAAEKSALARYGWHAFGAVVLFVLLVFAIRWLVHGNDDDVIVGPSTEEQVETPTKQPDRVGPEYVEIDVTGLPPGAQVTVDGLPVATMPMRVRRADRTIVIEVSAPGYGGREIRVQVDRDRSVPAGLRPMEGMGTRVGP